MRGPWTSQTVIEYGSDETALGKPMNPPPTEIGAPVAEVEIPTGIIDLEVLDRNIGMVSELARISSVRVRPHAKAHKSTSIAFRQIAHGAVGQTLQKAGAVRGRVSLSLGKKVWLLPGPCDPTATMYVYVRNRRVEALWPINARGTNIRIWVTWRRSLP
jgi:hypothetical protein